MKKPIIYGVVATALLSLTAFIIYIFLSFSIQNTEIDLRVGTISQNDVCKAFFDKMWKILKTKAEIPEKYKDAFKEIYIPMVEGRYSQGDGTLMKWIQESNPNFSPALYEDLMKSVEIERTGFFNQQKLLIDKRGQHLAFISKPFNKKFLSDTIKPVTIVIITSLATKTSYETGEENDVELFKKNDEKTKK